MTDRDSTQPCYHCTRGQRQRRSADKKSNADGATTEAAANNTALLYHVPLSKASPKYQVARFQTGYAKDMALYEYTIISGNDAGLFRLKKKAGGLTLLRLQENIASTGLYELEIEGVLQNRNDSVLAEVETVVVEPVAMQIQVQIVADDE